MKTLLGAWFLSLALALAGQNAVGPVIAPGAAVMVIQEGRVMLSQGYGYADLASRRPIGPGTPFLLGSMSKQFTAMAVMQLAERGKLSFEDPLSKFLPGFPEYARMVTIRHLLNHTAGFPEFDALFEAQDKIGLDWPRSIKSPRSPFEPTVDDAIEILRRVPSLRFTPGGKWEYSNSGYVLLAKIVEIVSGQSFPQFVRENIFEHLGMAHTSIPARIPSGVPQAATSYRTEKGTFADIDYAPQNALYGHDGVYTTLEDLYQWDQALYGEKLVKFDTLNEGFTSGRLNDGSDSHYGFGWRIKEFHGVKTISHGGAWLGFRTSICRIPERHLTVIVLANLTTFDVIGLTNRICEIYLK